MKDGKAWTKQHQSLNFKHSVTLVVDKELYAFKWGSPVSGYKISIAKNKRTTLATLPRDEYLEWFSLC